MDGCPIHGFTARTVALQGAQPPLLPETDIYAAGQTDPLKFELPHRNEVPGRLILAIKGPANPGRSDIINYQTEIDLFRRTGGEITTVMEPCPTHELFDGTSRCDRGVSAPVAAPVAAPVSASQTPETLVAEAGDFEELSDAAALAGRDWGPGTTIGCVRVSVQVRDRAGNRPAGYATQLQIHDVDPLTNCKDIDPLQHGQTFLVPQSRTTSYALLYEAGTGKLVSRAIIRTHYGHQTVVFDLDPGAQPVPSEPCDEPQELTRRVERIKAPDRIWHSYVDGSDRGWKPNRFIAHQAPDKTHSSLAASIMGENAVHAEAWVTTHRPNARNPKLLALINTDTDTFRLGPYGGDYQWLAYRWQDGQGMQAYLSGLREIGVEELLVEYYE